MSLHLKEIARLVAPDAHAVVLLDQAGWHQSKRLVVPDHITLVPLPAKGYLRKMLIHGARAALPSLANAQTDFSQWLRGLLARAHKNTAVVALAAKLARIVWAVPRSGQVFELRRGSASDDQWRSTPRDL